MSTSTSAKTTAPRLLSLAMRQEALQQARQPKLTAVCGVGVVALVNSVLPLVGVLPMLGPFKKNPKPKRKANFRANHRANHKANNLHLPHLPPTRTALKRNAADPHGRDGWT